MSSHFPLIKFNIPSRNTSSAIGVWVTPGYCSIGEFRVSEGVPHSFKWYEQIFYSDHEQLKNSLCALVKKRWLQGKPVVLTLSVPELYTVPFDDNPEKPVEKQALLPPGIRWDDIEYSIIKDNGDAAFACMRHSDIDSWVDFFRSTGLIVGQLVPAGIKWSRFFKEKGDVTCTLPSGILLYSFESKWQGSVFLPAGISEPSKSTISFSVPLQPAFEWCPAGLVPALEGVFSSIEYPDFNLNFKNQAAARILKAEKIAAKSIFYGAIGVAGIVGLMLLLIGILSIWRLSVGKSFRATASSISLIREENKSIQTKLGSYRTILSKKSDDAKILHDIGVLAKDSLWYSELNLSEGSEGVSVVIIGHSFSELAIAKFLRDAEALPGVKNAALEYTEKLSPEQAGRLTNSQIKPPLYRFKINMILSVTKGL